VAGGDLDDVEPQHVVQQPAAPADARTHEARQHIHARAAGRAYPRGFPGQPAQFTVAVGAEQRRELGPPFAGGEQALDVFVAQTVQRKRRGLGL